MSAVRMVAYGVLEMKPKKPRYDPDWLQPIELERTKKDDFERNQLRKLVNDELRRYGMLLQRAVVPRNGSWRTKDSEYILYGQVLGEDSAFPSREILHEGSFKECCTKAAELLDKLDASQIPEGGL